MAPAISVITPSFNQGRFIERTLQSVLSQSPPPAEYLVFDGGSSDGTVDTLKRYSERIRWVSEPDGGQAQAVNKGVRAASGEIIGWLNSDDVYFEGALARVGAAFAQHPEADVVYGAAHHIDTDDRIIEPYPTEPWNFARLTEFCFICQPAVFFKRSAAERWGCLDENLRYCMDYEYWLRLGLGGARFHYLPEALAGSRRHAGTKTLALRAPVHAEINAMLRRRLGKVPARWLFNYAHVTAQAWGPAQRSRLLRAAAIMAIALRAAVRWNGFPRGDMIGVLRRDFRRGIGVVAQKYE